MKSPASSIVEVKSMDSRARLLRLKYKLCHLIAELNLGKQAPLSRTSVSLSRDKEFIYLIGWL